MAPRLEVLRLWEGGGTPCGPVNGTSHRVGDMRQGRGSDSRRERGQLRVRGTFQEFSRMHDSLLLPVAEVRNYICDECGQTFKQRKHLSVHQMRHSGAKPLQ